MLKIDEDFWTDIGAIPKTEVTMNELVNVEPEGSSKCYKLKTLRTICLLKHYQSTK